MILKIKRISNDNNIAYSKENNYRISIYSNNDIIIPARKMEIIKTGLIIELQEKEYEIQVKSNSISAVRNGIISLPEPIILSNEELAVVLYNTSDKQFGVSKGMRICQIGINKPQFLDIIEGE